MAQSLHYNDIHLIPNYSEVSSRKLIDTSCILGKHLFKLPVIPANMKCVINQEIARNLDSSGYFYIMHRFGIDNLDFVKWASSNMFDIFSISIGTKEEDIQTLFKIAHTFPLVVHYITIDTAHGHHLVVKETIKKIKDIFPNAFIIAGNIGTSKAAEDLINWGSSAIKCGVGPGASCITRLKTGFYTPMFSTILNIRKDHPDICIIADGGIQENGDIAKALVAGANLVMAGSIFAQCIDSPAKTNGDYKEYYGSASFHNKGHSNNIEGKLKLIKPNNMSYLEKMNEIRQDLQSAISYSGGTDLKAFKNVEWGII